MIGEKLSNLLGSIPEDRTIDGAYATDCTSRDAVSGTRVDYCRQRLDSPGRWCGLVVIRMDEMWTRCPSDFHNGCNFLLPSILQQALSSSVIPKFSKIN